MPKRAATQTPAQLAAAEAAEAEVLYQAHFELIRHAKLPETCSAMLEAMMPCALRTPKMQRHAYQSTVIEAMDGLFDGILSAQQEGASSAETALETAKAATEAAEAADVSAKEAVTAAISARDEATTVAGGSGQGLLASAKALKTWASSTIQAAEDALARATERKDALALFESLRTGTLAEEKERAGAAERVARALGESRDSTLLEALPIALKSRPDCRGAFAERIVAEGAKAVSAASAVAAQEVKAAEKKLEEAKSFVAAADADCVKAREIHGSHLDVVCARENELAEKETAARASGAALRAARSELSAREAGLKESKASLTAVQQLLEQVKAKDAEPAASAPAEAPVEADVAMQGQN